MNNNNINIKKRKIDEIINDTQKTINNCLQNRKKRKLLNKKRIVNDKEENNDTDDDTHSVNDDKKLNDTVGLHIEETESDTDYTSSQEFDDSINITSNMVNKNNNNFIKNGGSDQLNTNSSTTNNHNKNKNKKNDNLTRNYNIPKVKDFRNKHEYNEYIKNRKMRLLNQLKHNEISRKKFERANRLMKPKTSNLNSNPFLDVKQNIASSNKPAGPKISNLNAKIHQNLKKSPKKTRIGIFKTPRIINKYKLYPKELKIDADELDEDYETSDDDKQIDHELDVFYCNEYKKQFVNNKEGIKNTIHDFKLFDEMMQYSYFYTIMEKIIVHKCNNIYQPMINNAFYYVEQNVDVLSLEYVLNLNKIGDYEEDVAYINYTKRFDKDKIKNHFYEKKNIIPKMNKFNHGFITNILLKQKKKFKAHHNQFIIFIADHTMIFIDNKTSKFNNMENSSYNEIMDKHNRNKGKRLYTIMYFALRDENDHVYINPYLLRLQLSR